jgi:di- and tripeptidase
MLLAKGVFRHDEEEEVLITGGGGGDIRLWKLDELQYCCLPQIFHFKNKGHSVLSLAYADSFLYAGLSEGIANIYNLSSGQLVQRLTVGSGDISQIQFNDGMICCGSSDGVIKVSLSVLALALSYGNAAIQHSVPGSRLLASPFWEDSGPVTSSS